MLGTPVNFQDTAEVETGREKPTPVGTLVVVVVVAGGTRAAFLSTVKDLQFEFGGKMPRPLFHREDAPDPPSQHTRVSEVVGTVSQGSPTSTSPAPVGTVMEGRGRV